jgi:anti-sigma factor RsiW
MRAVINCQQLIDFCCDYIDGSMPKDEQIRFTQHLSLCPDCVVFFETYRKTPELTREALATQMPPAVRESVRSFLRKQSQEDED